LTRYRGPSVPASGTLDRAAMIKGDSSSESSGNDNFAATSEGKAKQAAGAAGPASLQSYRPYGDTLMIPRAKHQHPPVNANSAAAAERGEAANREHQLLDYLDGRNVKSGADKNRSSEAGRTSVNSQYPDRSVSEVRSFDETTIQPSVRRPAKYYQSNDDSDNSNFDSL